MRRNLAIAAVAALLLAACGGGDDDSASIDPVTGATTATTQAMGGAGGAAGAEHAEHGGTDPAAPCSPSGSTVSIVASGTKFDKACLAAPANQPFTLNYDNRDRVTHNIVFLESHTSTEILFRAEIFMGPKTSTFNVAPLKAGTYVFHCEVHPGIMTGTLVVA